MIIFYYKGKNNKTKTHLKDIVKSFKTVSREGLSRKRTVGFSPVNIMTTVTFSNVNIKYFQENINFIITTILMKT